MKNLKLILMVMLLSVVTLTGCGKDTGDDVKPPETTNGGDTAVVQQVEIKAQALTDEVANMTEVTSYVGDTDGDGADETVVLATSAERNSKGDFLWNDGQNWALYVTDNSNGVYMLFDDFVQAGNVYFEVSDYYMANGAEPNISVVVSTGAGFSLKKYAFSNEKNAYVEEIVYDTKDVTEGGINRRFSSIPEI